MGPRRRNILTRREAQVTVAIALASGLVATYAGARPTGEPVPDAVLTFTMAALVTWAGASAAWWVLPVAAGSAALAAGTTPWLLEIAGGALGAAGFIAITRRSLAPLRAIVAGLAVQVFLRLEWDSFFGGSALAAAAVLGLIAASGLRRRSWTARHRLGTAAATLGLIGLAAMATSLASAAAARGPATEGAATLLDGLAKAQRGDTFGAALDLRAAVELLEAAEARLDSPWAQPSRLLPVFAPHRSALLEIGRSSIAAADDAADALELIDLDQLRVIGGVVDVDVIRLLAGPLEDLAASTDRLATALDPSTSGWLTPPFTDRIRTLQAEARTAAAKATVAAEAAAVGPAMLGADEPRRYFVAFTTPGESRGQSGLMGNWSEFTFTRGRFTQTASGRSADLSGALRADDPLQLEASAEFFDLYGRYGAGSPTTPMDPKFWSNVTMPPDTATVGRLMAQMYAKSTGRALDGVIIVDPAGLAPVLDLTGPVRLRRAGVTLTSATVVPFLLLDQYSRAEAAREDLLTEATALIVDALLGADLPTPEVLATRLGPAVDGGHLTMWAARPEEQQLLERIGLDGRLPQLDGRDGIALTVDNAAGNKIDSFLTREVRYTARLDEATRAYRAIAEIRLTNTAPTRGLPEYVIGNLIGEPRGTNRGILRLYSPHRVAQITVNGETRPFRRATEQGWNVAVIQVVIPPGGTVDLTATLDGALDRGRYALVLRPQPVAGSERWNIEVRSTGDRVLAGYIGRLTARSLLDASGIRDYRIR